MIIKWVPDNYSIVILTYAEIEMWDVYFLSKRAALSCCETRDDHLVMTLGLSFISLAPTSGRDKMADIFQTTCWNACFWMKLYEFQLRFNWICSEESNQHYSSIGSNNGLDQSTNHFWTNGDLDYWRRCALLGLNELTAISAMITSGTSSVTKMYYWYDKPQSMCRISKKQLPKSIVNPLPMHIDATRRQRCLWN